MTVVYILVAILVLMFMITVHEFGHYIAGKILGFKINEFSIGFGKALFKRTNKKGEVFAVRLVPLGGYCAFEGEDDAGAPGMERKEGETEDDADMVATKEKIAEQNKKSPKTISSDVTDGTKRGKPTIPFNKMPPWKRLIVLFSGAFANYLCAIVFSFILLMCVGYYSNVKVTKIDSAMSHNDIVAGDVITEVNGERFTLLSSFGAKVDKFENDEEFILTIIREGEPEPIPVTVSKQRIINVVDGTDYWGIGLKGYSVDYQKMSFGGALGKSFVFSAELAWLVLSTLGQMLVGQIALSDMGGTFSTISVMAQSVSNGMINLLILIPLISVNLAVFNLLPIPALDGARMVFVLIEWIRGKPVNPELEAKIHMWGLFILLGFVIFLDLNYLLFSRLLL